MDVSACSACGAGLTGTTEDAAFSQHWEQAKKKRRAHHRKAKKSTKSKRFCTKDAKKCGNTCIEKSKVCHKRRRSSRK